MICRWPQFSITCAVQPQCFKQDQHFFFLKKGTETTPQTDFFCQSACSLSVLPLSILYFSVVHFECVCVCCHDSESSWSGPDWLSNTVHTSRSAGSRSLSSFIAMALCRCMSAWQLYRSCIHPTYTCSLCIKWCTHYLCLQTDHDFVLIYLSNISYILKFEITC